MKNRITPLSAFILVANLSAQADLNIQDGLYFGKKGLFTPPVLVFATYLNPSFYLECYLHEKGEFISIKKDTLNYNDLRFEGNDCLIYMEKGKLFFISTESAAYKIRKTKIDYSPLNEDYLTRVRSKSRISWIK